jgi:hypothetical protein
MTPLGKPNESTGLHRLPIGRTLEMICFNQNQINFHFDEKLTIQVGTSLRYQQQLTQEPEIIEVPALQSSLMQLLGHSTIKAIGDNTGTLTLEFEDGQILECLDDTPLYESYQIVQGDFRIIV